MKKQKIIGALNYIVLRLAYEYQICVDFENSNQIIEVPRHTPWQQVNEWFADIAYSKQKKEFFATQKELTLLFKERLQSFSTRNDFVLSKTNTFIFMVLTVNKKDMKYLFDIFTDIEEDFYFYADEFGIKNKGVQKIFEEKDPDLFFQVYSYGSEITHRFNSPEELRNMIFEKSFSGNIEEGKKLIDTLDRNIAAITGMFLYFSNMSVDVCKYHIKNIFSFKFYSKVSFKKEEIEGFYECLFTENFDYQRLY